MRSITYWHPLIYSLLIRLSYGKGYEDRYKVLSSLIEDNSSIVDVCCGDCKIYSYLNKNKIDYLGLDFNPTFVRIAKKRQINVKMFNIYEDTIPNADYIIMLGSLNQFFPRHIEIINKLLVAARKYVIISEPVRNKTHSESKIISFIAKKLNNPGDGVKKYKFTIDTFMDALQPFRSDIVKEFKVANGIDYIAVIVGRHIDV